MLFKACCYSCVVVRCSVLFVDCRLLFVGCCVVFDVFDRVGRCVLLFDKCCVTLVVCLFTD